MLLSSMIHGKDSTIMLQVVIDYDTVIRRIYQYLSLIGETLCVIRLSTEKLKIALNYFVDVNYCLFCRRAFSFVCVMAIETLYWLICSKIALVVLLFKFICGQEALMSIHFLKDDQLENIT